MENVMKPNSKKLSAASERTLRRTKTKFREQLALFAEEEDIECLIAALYLGAAEDILLSSRNQCLKLHKVEGISVNQLNAFNFV